MLLSLARRVTTGGSSYSLNGALVVTICGLNATVKTASSCGATNPSLGEMVNMVDFPTTSNLNLDPKSP